MESQQRQQQRSPTSSVLLLKIFVLTGQCHPWLLGWPRLHCRGRRRRLCCRSIGSRGLGSQPRRHLWRQLRANGGSAATCLLLCRTTLRRRLLRGWCGCGRRAGRRLLGALRLRRLVASPLLLIAPRLARIPLLLGLLLSRIRRVCSRQAAWQGGGGGALGSEWDDRRSGQLARDAQQPAGVARERQQGGRSLPAVEARRASSASCSSCFSAGSLATSAGVCPCLLWAAGSALRASSTSTVSRCPAGRQAGGRHAGGESREGPRLAAGQLAGPSGQAAAWAAGRPSAAVCAACTRTLAGRQVQRVLARPQLSINLDACRVGEGGEGSKVTAHVGLATAGWRARWLAGAPAGWLRAARAAAVVKHTGAATPRAAGRPPSFSSHLMTGACPLSAAKCRAFMSSWAAAPGCAPAASSAFTPSRCPAYAARCSAVRRCRQAGTHEAAGRQG